MTDYSRYSNPAVRTATPRHTNPKTPCSVLASIGDVDPITYGGGFVFRCKQPGIPAFYAIEYVHGEESGPLVLYTEHLPDGDIWDYYNWADVKAVARSSGQDVQELRDWGSAGADPVTKAMAVREIASYYGWGELDQYPSEYTPAQLKARWRTAFRRRL